MRRDHPPLAPPIKGGELLWLPLPIVGEGWGEGAAKPFTPILTFPLQGGRKYF